MTRAFLAGVFVAAGAAAGWADTYCVAPDGDDANPATVEKPWKTLQKASASVRPGDTVLIKAGTYGGDGRARPAWRVTRAGTAEAPITYKAFGDGEVVIHNSRALPRRSIATSTGAPREPASGAGPAAATPTSMSTGRPRARPTRVTRTPS